VCTAAIAAWIWYGPGWFRRRHARTRACLRDQRAIPARAVLVRQPDELSIWTRARRAPRLAQEHEREQALRLGLVGHQLDQQATEPDRLGREVRPRQRAARRCRVPLVEHQVHDG